MHVIINIGKINESIFTGEACIIPQDKRPTYVHDDLESAESELLRLASTHPGQHNRFVIFSATAESEYHKQFIASPFLNGAFVLKPFKA